MIAYPELLGDGRVLFSSLTRDENGDAAQIILASPATSERRSLNFGGSQPRYLASGHLVFADQGQLVAVAFDANKQEVRGRVALVDGIAIASGTAAAQFAVSDSGTLVYLDYLASLSRRLVWVDRDGNTSSAQAGIVLTRTSASRLMGAAWPFTITAPATTSGSTPQNEERRRG